MYSRKWAERNPDKVKEKRHRQIDSGLNAHHCQQRRARQSELPCSLKREDWDDALLYFNYKCAYCGAHDPNLQKEHVVAQSKGGGYTRDNIIPACGSCNSSKQARSLEDWVREIRPIEASSLYRVYTWINFVA
ncbi:HNH endonuclease [Paenibacillus luteus]|uniref:HNH endonuclease n=1 Tax=Paenibacillus luteus TaxID=2545753 RepID=UPI001141D7AE